jgi:CRISPR system Cascade subunit CasE
MFLTRMQINPRRRGAQKLIGSPHAMHAAVAAGFPDARPTEDGRVLWRLDTHENQRVLLFVVSPDRPDFTHIAEQAGWPTTETWATKPYDPFLGSLRVGQHWQFRLTANPVHAGRRPGWADTKPLGHVTVKQQEQWLIDRTEKLGFVLVSSHGTSGGSVEFDLAVIDRSVRRFRRRDSTVTLATATFEGQLEVIDPALLRTGLTRGIGRGKSYGCGLLTLAGPPRPTQ